MVPALSRSGSAPSHQAQRALTDVRNITLQQQSS
jgi:hypothetical protein